MPNALCYFWLWLWRQWRFLLDARVLFRFVGFPDCFLQLMRSCACSNLRALYQDVQLAFKSPPHAPVGLAVTLPAFSMLIAVLVDKSMARLAAFST